MSLEETLKTQALTAVGQSVGQWNEDLRQALAQHQEAIGRSLDALHQVARLDAQALESGVVAAIATAVASQPPPPAVDLNRLKTALSGLDRATSLSEAMTVLVNEAAQFVERAAMLIVKGNAALGWYGRGASPDAVRGLNAPLTPDNSFGAAFASRQPSRERAIDVPLNGGILARLGGHPHDIVIVPLVLRDKVAAILYGDSSRPIAAADADAVEILVQYATKTIDLLTLSKGAARPATASVGGAERAAAVKASDAHAAAAHHAPVSTAPPPVPRPAPAAAVPHPAAPGSAETASTVMFPATAISEAVQQAAPAAPAPALSPEDQKAHDQAKRFARLVVSEIRLYNEAKVTEGRKQKDLYERLKEDIERGRQVYTERVPARVRDTTNYFYEELVRILAGGDATALGPM